MVVLLLAPIPPAGGLTEQERAGGWSGALPKGIPHGIAPKVEMVNVTVPASGTTDPSTGPLTIRLSDDASLGMYNLTLLLEIYRWGRLGEERDLLALGAPLPSFRSAPGIEVGPVDGRSCIINASGPVPTAPATWDISVNVTVPPGTALGFYRIRMRLDFDLGRGVERTAQSRGHFDDATWGSLLAAARQGKDLTSAAPGISGLLPEYGFTVAPYDFLYISRPNRVPDLGNFTTPTIRPGLSGTYNFTVTNRYDEDIDDVELRVEIYMWATLESSRPIGRLGGPAPRFEGTRTTNITSHLGTIGAHLSKDVTLDISTGEDTPKGTYFVEHRLTFAHNGTVYTMSSRGYFTSAQWEGFAYNNLYYQLGVSGIIPDSSFNVKDPVPLWPLGVLVTLCALFGALAVVFYLAEEHGSEHPRLKKALQYWTGKYEQRRRLLEQRLDELRREVDVADEDDEG